MSTAMAMLFGSSEAPDESSQQTPVGPTGVRTTTNLAPTEYNPKWSKLVLKGDFDLKEEPPSTRIVYVMKGELDIKRLRGALVRVITKNPLLAGRLKSLSKEDLEGSDRWFPSFCCAPQKGQGVGAAVAFGDSVGVPLYEKAIPGEHLARIEALTFEEFCGAYLDYEAIFEEICESVGSGQYQMNMESALCCFTYAVSEKVSLLSMSLSHVLGDVYTHSAIMKCISDEYKDPESSQPLEDREGMRQDAYWDYLGECVKLIPDLACCMTIKVAFREETLEAIREKMRAEMADPQNPDEPVGRNSALLSFVCSVLRPRFFGVTYNLRGRYQSMPERMFGNGFAKSTSDKTNSDKTSCKVTAKEIKKVTDTFFERKPHPKIALDTSAYFTWNNWCKVQFPAEFDGMSKIALPVLGLHKLQAQQGSRVVLVQQANPGEYLMTFRGLSASHCQALEKAFKALSPPPLLVQRINKQAIQRLYDSVYGQTVPKLP